MDEEKPDPQLAAAIEGEPVAPAAPAPPDDRALADKERNDLGNAERLLGRFGSDLLYVVSRGFFVWTGVRFRRDGVEPLLSLPLAHQTSRAIMREVHALQTELDRLQAITWPRLESAAEFRTRLEDLAKELPSAADLIPPDWLDRDLWEDEVRKPVVEKFEKRVSAHRSWAVQSGNQSRAKAMLTSAAPYRTVEQSDLDRDPWLLTVANGTLELGTADATGNVEVTLRDARREDRITRAAAASWDAGPAPPRFMAFLERVQPDPEIRAFLQRFMGLCLTGDPTEQAAVIHHGLGANGKSVFLELMRYVLGDYGETIAAAKLIGRDRANGGSPDPALARLAGVRLLTASEPEPGAFVQEDVLKNLLGMETISVRDMYAGLFDFLPVFKVMIACNEKPRVKGGDDGIWRRLHLVPWSVTIPAAERDRGLLDALKLEANGILGWAVEGYKEWRRLGGLKPPEVIRAATDAYRSVSDPLGDFFNDCVERPAPGAHIEATDMYLVYLAWCDVTQTTPITQKTFGMAVTNRGFDRRKVSTYRYLDCKLRYWADASPEDLIERGRQRAERGSERSGDRRSDGLDV